MNFFSIGAQMKSAKLNPSLSIVRKASRLSGFFLIPFVFRRYTDIQRRFVVTIRISKRARPKSLNETLLRDEFPARRIQNFNAL